MGLFSQSKPDPREEQRLALEQEPAPFDEPFDALPKLPKPQSNTVIAQGITVNGTIQGEGTIQVEGTLEGELHLNGSLIVTTTGLIQGPVTADLVRVAGQIKGNITARSHLRLEQTGKIEGDVSTASPVVEDGGSFDGRSSMLKPPKQESTPSQPLDEDLLFGPNYSADSQDGVL